jgi:pSer/pThr/pTyr-binding forkhead associated (FHA) protein
MQSKSPGLPGDFCFRVVKGPDTGRTYPLAEETRVGRDPKADVFIGNITVARWQCILVWDGDKGCHFIDQAWFRPVFINDRQIGENERVPLQAADRIRIADTTFVYAPLTAASNCHRPVDRK